MTIRLRSHHLLCILTYVGKGYSPAFTDNMTQVAERLSSGEEVEIVEGPDAICAPLLDHPTPHCSLKRVTARDRLATQDLSAILGINCTVGSRLTLDQGVLRNLRRAFATSELRRACTGCEWFGLCSSIAGSGFESVVLSTRANRIDERH